MLSRRLHARQQDFHILQAHGRVQQRQLQAGNAIGFGDADVGATGSQQHVADTLVEQRNKRHIVACRTEAEQHACQLRLHHQLQIRLGFHKLSHIAGQRDAVINDFGILLFAQRFEAHPQLQRVETARGLQRLRYQVRYAVLFIEIRVQVRRLIAHQLIVARVFQQERAAADGLEELFVEVQGYGIRQFEAVQEVTILFREQQRATPCRVNVHPDLVFCRQRRDVR